MALNLLLDGRVTKDRLDRRFVLLHHCSAAVLGRQRTVAGRSDWVARLGFDWAIRLTRHPRSKLGVLPFGSWLGVPATTLSVAGLLISPKDLSHAHTISMIFPWVRVKGALMHRKICRKHSILTEVADLIRDRIAEYSMPLYEDSTRRFRKQLKTAETIQTKADCFVLEGRGL